MKYIVAIIAVGLLLYLGLHFAPQPAGDKNLPLDTRATSTTPHESEATTTPSTTKIYSVATVLARPADYHNRQICLRGYYETTFEFSALGATYHQDDKQKSQIDKPYIWVGLSVPRSQLTCATQGLYCFGQATVCGLFEVAADGAAGFGQLGLYRYQIR